MPSRKRVKELAAYWKRREQELIESGYCGSERLAADTAEALESALRLHEKVHEAMAHSRQMLCPGGHSIGCDCLGHALRTALNEWED